MKPERQAQLEEYAHRRGQDPAAALDEALGAYLEWERHDFEEAVQGIRRGFEDVKAGQTRPAVEFLTEVRVVQVTPPSTLVKMALLPMATPKRTLGQLIPTRS